MKLSEKDYRLLVAIRDGQKYSKANGPLAKLSQRYLAQQKGTTNEWYVTEWGLTVIEFFKKENGWN